MVSLLGCRTTWTLDLLALGAALAVTPEGPGPLAVLGAVLFEDHKLYDTLSMPRPVLLAYLRSVEDAYKCVPYHNAQHATCVLHSCNYALVSGGLAPSLTRTEVAAMLLAAAVHDVGHPGRTNAFLVASSSPLALRYNDVSVLESFHAATAFELMSVPGRDVCASMPPQEAAALRRLIIALVLATDTDRHDELLHSARAAGPGGLRLEAGGHEAHRLLSQQLVLKFADLGSAAKPLSYALRWAAAITAEFFAEGDEARRLGLPVPRINDRNDAHFVDAQLSFLDNICLGMFEAFAEVVPTVGRAALARLAKCRSFIAACALPVLASASAAGASGDNAPSTIYL